MDHDDPACRDSQETRVFRVFLVSLRTFGRLRQRAYLRWHLLVANFPQLSLSLDVLNILLFASGLGTRQTLSSSSELYYLRFHFAVSCISVRICTRSDSFVPSRVSGHQSPPWLGSPNLFPQASPSESTQLTTSTQTLVLEFLIGSYGPPASGTVHSPSKFSSPNQSYHCGFLTFALLPRLKMRSEESNSLVLLLLQLLTF